MLRMIHSKGDRVWSKLLKTDFGMYGCASACQVYVVRGCCSYRNCIENKCCVGLGAWVGAVVGGINKRADTCQLVCRLFIPALITTSTKKKGINRQSNTTAYVSAMETYKIHAHTAKQKRVQFFSA